QGAPAEDDPATYRQAGELLALVHRQDGRLDAEHHVRTRAIALRWLEGEHRIAPATVRRLRTVLAGHPSDPVTVVPTHGDYTPRNWLMHQGEVAVIDFGRAVWRP